MRALEIVHRKIDLRTIDANVGIVGKGQTDALVDRENELAVGNVILQPLGRRQLRRTVRPAVEAEPRLER